MFNSRNEQVGELIFYKGESYYFTIRDQMKGNIFVRKNYFQGKYLPNGVAVDVDIVKKLFANKIAGIIFHIKNFERRSFYGKIDLIPFMEKSVSICYDRFSGNKNLTKYGKQRLVSMEELEVVKL